MSIKLPEVRVVTRDEQRAQFIAQHKHFTEKVENAVLDLTSHHRPRYEHRLFTMWWKDIQDFLEIRGTNETPYDDIAKRARNKERVPIERKRQAENRMAYLSKYTTLPKYEYVPAANQSTAAVDRNGIDFTDFQQWSAWLDNLERSAFTVEFLPTAETDLKRRAKEYVDAIAKQFVHKTVDKVIDILIAKGGRYKCNLDKGQFTFMGFEGDIKISFPDQTGFRTHVIVKDNTSVLGNPYVQYPLTFHEVIGVTGDEPVAMLSQEMVFNRFGVKQWQAAEKVRKPWTNVKAGDLVQTNTLSLCMILGIRGTVATLYHPSKGEYKIEGSEIKAILARTTIDDWTDRERSQLEVEPHDGEPYKVQVQEEDMSRIRNMPFGFRKDTETRKACLPEALRQWAIKSN